MKVIFLAVVLGIAALLSGCDNVPAGHVGIQVSRYGGDRGVNIEVKQPGRYFNGWNVDMFLFPTFTQSYVWSKTATEQSSADESFSFQTIEGLGVNTDVGISYSIQPDHAAKVFQKYRRGIDEITTVYLRAMVRDTLNMAGSSMAIEDVYGKGKADLQKRVEDEVKKQADAVGITVESVYFVNEMRLPKSIVDSINSKMAATQLAQQKENELRSAEADAAKSVAKARGEAEATRITGEALRTNPQALQQLAIEKWDGKLPAYLGSSAPVPFVGQSLPK